MVFYKCWKWVLYDSFGTRYIALDVWDRLDTANGTKIDCYAYNGTNAQKWKLTKAESKPLENGTYSIYKYIIKQGAECKWKFNRKFCKCVCDK